MTDLNQFKMFPENLCAAAGYAIVATSVHGHVDQGHDGFYWKQTRFLSRLVLTVDGKRPLFVSANPVDPYSMIAYYAARGLVLQVDRFVGGGMHQDLTVTNHGLAATTVEVAWEVAADFADLEEVMDPDGRRQQQGGIVASWREDAEAGELVLTYGHPGLPHATALRFARGPSGPRHEGGRVVYQLELAPKQAHRLCLDVTPIFLGERIAPVYGCGAFRSHSTSIDEVRDAWLRDCATLETPNPVVQAAWDRAIHDLGALPLLEGEGRERFVPAAGIPLYQELYGRDPLTTGWQASLASPLMLEGTLSLIGRHLGTKHDPAHDEQPGRVIQQAKESPLALLGINPFRKYYGDYAGPGMYLVAAGWHFAQTGDRDFIRRIMPRIEAVLAWIDTYADLDGDGFFEYETHQPDLRGKNQGWMDSPDALRYEDGRMMPNPIAVVEIQGYYFAAKQLMGLMFLFLGDVARGTELLARAQDLKRRFNQAFWLPDERFYAQALDPAKRPVRNVASNMGHCLACGIVDADKAPAGLVPLAPLHTLVLDPDLPDWLPELTLRNVRVGEARVSLRLRRDASGHTDYQVLEKAGRLHVVRQAPPESVTVGLSDRLADALGSLLHR